MQRLVVTERETTSGHLNFLTDPPDIIYQHW
jgi:hypothetical protein